jgi:hypothetical protein
LSDANITCQHPDCAEADQPSPAWGGTRLCGLHQRGLQADIDDIARVLTLIETHHDELALPSGSGESVRGVPSSRPPMRLGVLDVLTGQTAERITGWAADVVRTSRALAVPEAARLLARNIDLLCCHIAVDIVAVELRQAAGACRAVLPDDRWNTEDDDKKPRPAGRCTQPHPDDPGRDCNGSLLWVPATLVVRCARCHHEQEPDGYVAKRVVLRAFGLSRWTLNRWIADGKVAASNDFVCVDDVREVVRQRHTEEGA